ncbi:hypothetical protein Tco_0012892 [Tanacetum coccineum]
MRPRVGLGPSSGPLLIIGLEPTMDRNSARLGGCILRLTPNVFRARRVFGSCPSGLVGLEYYALSSATNLLTLDVLQGDCWYLRTIVTIHYLSSCPSNGKRGYVYASHALRLSV